MYLHILNYGVRIVIIIMGALMAFGYFSSPRQDPAMMRMLGIVLILFGVYRMAMYYTRQQRRFKDDDENPL